MNYIYNSSHVSEETAELALEEGAVFTARLRVAFRDSGDSGRL